MSWFVINAKVKQTWKCFIRRQHDKLCHEINVDVTFSLSAAELSWVILRYIVLQTKSEWTDVLLEDFRVKETEAHNLCLHQPSLFKRTDRTFSFTSSISCSDGLICFIPILSAHHLLLCFIPHVCQAGFSGQHESFSAQRGMTRSLNRAETGHLPAVGGHVRDLSIENGRTDRLNRLNSETHALMAQRQTDPYHPRVTDIPANPPPPRVGYLFA